MVRIRYIKRLRILLLGLIILGIGVLLWPLFRNVEEEQNLSSKQLTILTQEAKDLKEGYKVDIQTQVENPILYGKDSKGQPFKLNALRAIENTQDEIKLEKIEGYIELTLSKRWIKITANEAYYFPKAQRLEASGEVIVTTSDNYLFTTNMATLTHKHQYYIVGDKPVHVKSPRGSIDAEGFVIDEKDQSITFIGRVHTIFE